MRENFETLNGGRKGKIKMYGDKVVRPANEWSSNVHKFLDFIIREGFNFVPKPYGFTENNEEILSFVIGTAYNYPLPEIFLKDDMIIRSAELLKRFHELGKKYIKVLHGSEKWMLPKVDPIEVMCHGDFAPYNVTIIDEKPVGIIDFDTLHPGPALWDVAYAVYRWIPFTSPKNPDHYDDIDEQIRKVSLFMDAYNAALQEREALPKVMVQRLNALISYMTAQANDGNEDFAKHLEDGHILIYKNDINYIIKNERKIINGIKKG